jgi:hypothetical protein
MHFFGPGCSPAPAAAAVMDTQAMIARLDTTLQDFGSLRGKAKENIIAIQNTIRKTNAEIQEHTTTLGADNVTKAQLDAQQAQLDAKIAAETKMIEGLGAISKTNEANLAAAKVSAQKATNEEERLLRFKGVYEEMYGRDEPFATMSEENLMLFGTHEFSVPLNSKDLKRWSQLIEPQ